MLKKTITYVDFNGLKRTEDFYFNLSKSELTEMELLNAGGLSSKLKEAVAARNVPEMVQFFKTLILNSYGKKSEDGRRFIKNPELSEEFYQSEAYSTLFMELATVENEMVNFIKGIVPSDLAAKLDGVDVSQVSLEELINK